MSFLNSNGAVSNLSFEDIPTFIREYLRDYARPLTVSAPGVSDSVRLSSVIDDLETILEDESLDTKTAMPMLFVLWTNLITRMARVETLTSMQQQCNDVMKVNTEEDNNAEKKESTKEETGKREV